MTSGTNNKEATRNERPEVHIYPHDTPLEAIKSSINAAGSSYRCTKYVHFIRHGQGAHNVNQEYHSIENIDARLTEKGQAQCHVFAQSILEEKPHLLDTQLVVTSPLTRCIQTALLSLHPALQNNPELPVVAHESVRETVNYNCDRRRSVAEISAEHPRVDFTHVEHDRDPIWHRYEERLGEGYNKHRESAELHVVAERGRQFFAWLARRPEERVVVCSHAAFLRCLLNFGQAWPVPFQPPQNLDTRTVPSTRQQQPSNVPVVRYMDNALATSMKLTFDNRELRSLIVAFE